jgi:glutamate 5-kinase
VPRDQQLGARKSWIKFGARPSGVISVDAGASRALRELGKSLLPSGLLGVSGDFGPGAAVDLQNEAGNTIARGLVAYSASEIRRLRGLRSEQIAETLGYSNGDAVIHRDDLVLLDETGAAGTLDTLPE